MRGGFRAVRQVQALPFGLQSVHGDGFTAVWVSAAVGALGCSRSHFDQGCFAAVAGAYGLAWVVVRCFSADVCDGELRRAAFVGLTYLVASHAVLTWRAGEGGGLILPALAKSAPTLPSPPRHPGTARCAACGIGDRGGFAVCSSAESFCQPLCQSAFSLFRVSPHSGAGAHGIARARGEPFRQSLLAVCGGRLTP